MSLVMHVPIMIGASDLEGAIDTSDVSGTDMVVGAAVAVATIVVAWAVGRATRRYLSRPDTSSLEIAGLAARAAKWVVIFIGMAWSLSFLGADPGWFTITIALVVVMAILVMKPMLEKFAAGVTLNSRPAFSVGDDIGVIDFDGTVLEITGRSTVLRLRDGRRVHIPNTRVLDETIVVYTTEQKRRTSVDLEVEGRHSVADVERVLLGALADADAVASEPAPRVRARGFGGDLVSLSVRFWHESGLGESGEALDQAMRAMSAALQESGMALASPSLAVEFQSSGDAHSPPAGR